MKVLFLKSVVVFTNTNGETTVIPKTNEAQVMQFFCDFLNEYLYNDEVK